MEPMNAAATIIGKKCKKTHSLKTREKKKKKTFRKLEKYPQFETKSPYV